MFRILFAVAEPSTSNFNLVWLSALFALILPLVHLFSSKLRFLERTPRSIWLSVSGGVSVAYVFVHILPELSQAWRQLKVR
ncbi:MAG: hypothetical protein CLLPBCKN_000838 [Chroococcidiopsis cubana SAG 39.79]|nr:hypothetical protein [Chroococcidiopsis cubana SAG 39.79]